MDQRSAFWRRHADCARREWDPSYITQVLCIWDKTVNICDAGRGLPVRYGRLSEQKREEMQASSWVWRIRRLSPSRKVRLLKADTRKGTVIATTGDIRANCDESRHDMSGVICLMHGLGYNILLYAAVSILVSYQSTVQSWWSALPWFFWRLSSWRVICQTTMVWA